MELAERNEMRIRICELTVELEHMLSIPEQYRSSEAVERLREQIASLESEIQRDLNGNGSS